MIRKCFLSRKLCEKANAKQFTLTDKKGKEIPIRVYYSHKEEGLMMVVSDVVDSNIQIESNTRYTLTIGNDLRQPTALLSAMI